MPQLIKGYMRYTDEDYLLQDFENTVRVITHNQTKNTLIKQLADEVNRLIIMSCDNRANYVSLYDTIYKDTLKQALVNLVALTQHEGHTLTTLLSQV